MNGDVGILILAGGEATRLPGKLTLPYAPELPMIVRVYENVRAFRNAPGGTPCEIVISAKATFELEIDARLPVAVVIDRWPGRGPLAGMLTAFAQMRSRFVFAVAGDAPFVDSAFIARLDALRRHDASDAADAEVAASAADAAYNTNVAKAATAAPITAEAYIPTRPHENASSEARQLEPLAALYDRLAFLREGLPVLRSGRGSLRAVIDRLRAKFVPIDDARVFTNVNTPTDYAALRARLAGENR